MKDGRSGRIEISEHRPQVLPSLEESVMVLQQIRLAEVTEGRSDHWSMPTTLLTVEAAVPLERTPADHFPSCSNDDTAVPNGVSMSPLPASRQLPELPQVHLWDVRLREEPHPDVLPDAFDLVRVGMAAGKPALDALDAREVGPVLCCMAHHVLLIAVPAGTVVGWRAPQTKCRPSRQRACADPGELQLATRCADRLWMVPAGGGPTTDPDALQESLGRTRDRLRTRPVRARPGRALGLGAGI